MPHTSCLASKGAAAACSAALVLVVVQLDAVSACLLFWAFATLLYKLNLTVCAGTVCLHSVC